MEVLFKMIKKILGVLVMMLALAVSVSAADFAFAGVKVNDIPVTGSALYVELGDTLDIDVAVTGTSSTNHDTRLRAWIGGYEYELLETSTEMFAVRSGVVYQKHMQLQLPSDMVTSNHGYTLNLEMVDANNHVEKTYALFVSEKRHNIVVQDVILQPTSLEAGKAAFVKVRLENMGAKKEEDVRVEVSIPGLGVSERTYIDELNAYNNDENSESTETLYLRLPQDAQTGDYEMFVTVVYNRGHSVVQGKKLVHVEGKAVNAAEDSKALVVVETGSEGMTLGEGKDYSVMIVNLGNEAKAYTVDVSGVSSWGSASVSPQMLQLAAGESGEMVVSVDAKEAGTHQLTLTVSEDGKLLKQSTIVVDVVKKHSAWPWVVAGAVVLLALAALTVKLLKGNGDADVHVPEALNAQEPFY